MQAAVLNKFEIDFDCGLEYFGKSFCTKIKLVGKCENCGEDFKARYDKLRNRKIFPFEKLCTKCIRVLTSRSAEAKANNSKAQLIAQNKPSRLKQNTESSKRWWRNLDPATKTTLLGPFRKHNKKLQNNPQYAAENRRRSGKTITGEVLINNKWIKFDSGYELLFLYSKNDSECTIRRCEFVIPYGKFTYNPDFWVAEDGATSVIEIKGYYNNRCDLKAAAAQTYIKDTGIADIYTIIGIKELKKAGILEKESSTYVWKQIRKIYNGSNIKFTHKNHQLIAKHGKRWYYKNKKNN